MSGILYLAATPIGNLGDLTPRVAAELEKCDFVAAEDTRVTLKILNHIGIKKELVSYHRHSDHDRAIYITERLLGGESCVLCCDAGTPGISDPGEELVMLAAERGIRIVPLPGACAAISALSASGLVTGRFCFEGFLPQNKKNRRARLEEIENEKRTMIFYEAPHKLVDTLKDLFEAFGNRKITLARELTKLHEEFIRTELKSAVTLYSQKNEPRGEFVLIVEGAREICQKEEFSEEQALELARGLVKNGTKATEACRLAAEKTGLDRKQLYRMLSQERNNDK